MIFIEPVAKALYPALSDKNLSTACLCTSNPVYLIFTEGSSYPEIVIRLSETDNISRPHNILVELYKYLGELIPEPVLQTRHDAKYISIQKGVKGTPWFQLAGKIRSMDEWDMLRSKAVETLNTLHQGIQSSEKWNRSGNPGEELRQCYLKCISSDITLPEKTDAIVTELANKLDNLGNITVYPQHGDFCLNNLIIEDSKMHIIDFEDFGMTYMPLHDQFTLALSTYQLAPDIAKSSLQENIGICINDNLESLHIDRSFVPGFFMHHLLLRLGEWSQNRLPYRRWLLSILQSFVDDMDLLNK